MAQFNQLVLTDKGAALLAKIQQSARPLIFIYAEASDGVLPQG